MSYKCCDADLGSLPTPYQKARWSGKCFSIYPIYTNSLGFRGGEWSHSVPFKIAILGDSVLIAQHISETDHTAAVLGRLLRKEILNAALGGRGTLDELSIYRKFVAPLKPNITILFFTSNDISDNSCELRKVIYRTDPEGSCGYVSNGKINLLGSSCYAQNQDQEIRKSLRTYCFSCVFLKRSISSFLKNKGAEVSLDYFFIFRHPKTKAWQEAWKITEYAILELKKEVESTGGKLIIVANAECLRISGTWKDDLKKENMFRKSPPPADLDPFYPVRRLEEFTRQNGIAFLELNAYFLEYRDRFNLKPPYIAYYCDGHLNPVAHFLMAQFVARYLIEKNLIPLTAVEKDRLLKKIERHINLSPQEILGEKAYRQIYNKGGFYLGSSNISKILEDDLN
jgi:hypothetical protein